MLCSRKRLSFDELPEEMKKDIRELNNGSLKFFHCEKCDEISISFELVSF